MSKIKSGLDGWLKLPLGEKGEETPPRAGTSRAKEAVREALRVALNRCHLDRKQVAEELSRLTGDYISESVLNTWTAESKDNRRFPLEYVAALTTITGDASVIEAALSGTGLTLLTREQAPFYELGVLTARELEGKKRKRRLLEQLL